MRYVLHLQLRAPYIIADYDSLICQEIRFIAPYLIVNMPSWRDEYLGSLRDSELRNPVNMELVQTCDTSYSIKDYCYMQS